MKFGRIGHSMGWCTWCGMYLANFDLRIVNDTRAPVDNIITRANEKYDRLDKAAT